MSIRFLCNSCGTAIKARDEYSGRSVRCPHCKERAMVPGEDQHIELGVEEDVEEDYGLAAMSLGVIDMAASEAPSGKTKNRPALTRKTEINEVAPSMGESDVESRSETLPGDAKPSYSVLIGVSLGLRLLAAFTAVFCVYLLGTGFFSIFSDVSTPIPQQASNTHDSPFVSFIMTFIVGGTAVCVLAGSGELIHLLLDIRENVLRNKRK